MAPIYPPPPHLPLLTADDWCTCESCRRENFEGELVLTSGVWLVCLDCLDWRTLIQQAQAGELDCSEWAWADTRRHG